MFTNSWYCYGRFVETHQVDLEMMEDVVSEAKQRAARSSPGGNSDLQVTTYRIDVSDEVLSFLFLFAELVIFRLNFYLNIYFMTHKRLFPCSNLCFLFYLWKLSPLNCEGCRCITLR